MFSPVCVHSPSKEVVLGSQTCKKLWIRGAGFCTERVAMDDLLHAFYHDSYAYEYNDARKRPN